MKRKQKGKTAEYIFNYERLYGKIFKPGTTIVKGHIRKKPSGGYSKVKTHKRRV